MPYNIQVRWPKWDQAITNVSIGDLAVFLSPHEQVFHLKSIRRASEQGRNDLFTASLHRKGQLKSLLLSCSAGWTNDQSRRSQINQWVEAHDLSRPGTNSLIRPLLIIRAAGARRSLVSRTLSELQVLRKATEDFLSGLAHTQRGPSRWHSTYAQTFAPYSCDLNEAKQLLDELLHSFSSTIVSILPIHEKRFCYNFFIPRLKSKVDIGYDGSVWLRSPDPTDTRSLQVTELHRRYNRSNDTWHVVASYHVKEDGADLDRFPPTPSLCGSDTVSTVDSIASPPAYQHGHPVIYDDVGDSRFSG